MTAQSVIRRRPFAVAEVVLVVLLTVGGAAYAWLVSSTTPGAWNAANVLLALASLLGVVLAAHAVIDFHRLVSESGWPASRWLAVAGACWRLLELGLVVVFVVLGLISGALATDLAAASGEGEGTLGMVLIVWVLIEAAILGVLVLMIPARVLATGRGSSAGTEGRDGSPRGGDDPASGGGGSPSGGGDSASGGGGSTSDGEEMSDGQETSDGEMSAEEDGSASTDGDSPAGDDGEGYVPRSSG